MQNIQLNGNWAMKSVKDTEWNEAIVPGSVLQDLLREGKIEDPFYRDNEKRVKEIMYDEFEYKRTFLVESDFLMNDKIILLCEGLDTLAEVKVNGKTVSITNNMHRTYELDVKQFLLAGENEIHVIFSSSLEFIEGKEKDLKLWGPSDSLPGFPHIRKAHYMFGWDWGPVIPDAGIWRSISIQGYQTARIKDVYITQTHANNQVGLTFDLEQEAYTGDEVECTVNVTSPDGEKLTQSISTTNQKFKTDVTVTNPQLWWPNGYGEQPLYNVEVILTRNEVTLDSKIMKIGLRTLTVRTEDDEWGKSFEFVINGIAIFAQGANYIPEDNLLGRTSKEKTERLIQDCIAANFNCIRVWGGGIYPGDDFFDLCDEYGLIVWEDLMFACGVYELTKEFAENIAKEAEDNIRRIRHHASLGLWCGNNEMEMGWEDWDFPKDPKLRADYIKQFEVILQNVVEKTDPNRVYWPASPSSGGSFDKPNDENRGDVHYWDVWHGLKPFTDYRNYYFRFCSEFGFQSFPSLKTIESFTLPEDRNIFSYVMERHQKNQGANGKILYYLAQNFKYPKDFDSLLYTSQILQAEAIKYGVEHWRRNRGRCMGATYWQLNDCWPVASWSSIDSFGRWKALHYFAKRFYAPVLLSACEEGTDVSLHVTNESMEDVQGTVIWKLRDINKGTLAEGTTEASIKALSAQKIVDLDFSNQITETNERTVYLDYSFVSSEKKNESFGTLLFVPNKHFELPEADITFNVNEIEEGFSITLHSSTLAQYVELAFTEVDGRFSDNYFDLTPDQPKTVILKNEDVSTMLSLEELRKQLVIRSMKDIEA